MSGKKTKITTSVSLSHSGISSSILATRLKSGDFSESSLLKLVGLILSRLDSPSSEGKVLLHVPAVLSTKLMESLELPQKPGSKDIYLYEWNNTNSGQSELKPAGKLPQRHQLRNELLLVIVSEKLCAFVSAWNKNGNKNIKSHNTSWTTILSFADSEVLDSITSIERLINGHLNEEDAVFKWLNDSATVLTEISGTEKSVHNWENSLPDIMFDIERQERESESRLKWLQLLNKVHEAVGWELETGRLFRAISQVLKDTIGFDYLEIQVIDGRGKKFDVTAVHHRNDTSFGGELLTVIMRPECRLKILQGRKPVLIDVSSAEETLMNPRLMKYMGFKSGVVIPLINQKKPNGLLKLFAHGVDHFTADDLAGMEAIGHILARSIENMKLHSLLKRMATMDGLTNLFNRRFFSEQLTREFKRAQRYGSSLTLIMIDIDFFKNYNDSFGHLRGDSVLRKVSDLLKKCVREVDFVARYGGEEFAVILPEANLERGMVVAEKIRQTVEEYPFKYKEKQPGGKLTLSLGVASNTKDVEDINELINRADVALYRAKKSGRNRCEAFR
ncbi:MAG: sensor domain-containing diguanylate cyclase [Calditrichaeota bacterium]|nr:sensor domain-containing diguanylate cyclase [Calditrichota bacterium]